MITRPGELLGKGNRWKGIPMDLSGRAVPGKEEREGRKDDFQSLRKRKITSCVIDT